MKDLKALDGSSFDASELKGRVVLITNVASACGYTRANYDAFKRLTSDYGSQGLVILAQPSNQFGKQEPGTPKEIRDFVQSCGVHSVPLLQKGDVKGDDITPLYKALLEATATESVAIDWNFATKLLVARDGVSVERFDKAFDTEKLRPNIDALLKEHAPA